MALQKKIKTKHLRASAIMDIALGATWRIGETWIPQDDIRIVGFELYAQAHIEVGHVAAIDCYIETVGVLTLNAEQYSDGTLGECWALVDETQDANGNLRNGTPMSHLVVMYLENHGVDVNALQPVYLCWTRDETGFVGPNGVHLCAAIIYYVER